MPRRESDEKALLISSDRMYYRAAAQVAYDACFRGFREPRDRWLKNSIDRGIDGILEDEESDHQAGIPVDPSDEEYYHAVTDLLDVSLEHARAVCISFNTLPFDARDTYFEYTRLRSRREAESPGKRGSVHADLARALMAILAVGGGLE